MTLVTPASGHLFEMMKWFSSERELKDWSGPNFAYPFNMESFSRDLKLDSLRSFSLVGNKSTLTGFGQYYQRLDRCHLARLVIKPSMRGSGLASALMHQLCELGLHELGLNSSSLFVLKRNQCAINAYKKFGFVAVDYPEEIPLEDCLYMIKHSEIS